MTDDVGMRAGFRVVCMTDDVGMTAGFSILSCMYDR